MNAVARNRHTFSRAGAGGPVRVMVVDDSAAMRGLISGWLSSEPGIEVVARCGNGLQALKTIGVTEIDVVFLDIEMPEMDGLTALPKLLKAVPGLNVVIVSTLTKKNAQTSLQAIALGAADYITKPSNEPGAATRDDFRRALVAKAHVLGAVRQKNLNRTPTAQRPVGRLAPAGDASAPIKRSGFRAESSPRGAPALRKARNERAEIIAIASSTGGPQALAKVVTSLCKGTDLPVVIVQHMPAMFTAILAEHLQKSIGRPCTEGKDSEPILKGRVYIAPGGKHMVVADERGRKIIKLLDSPPEHHCRPAADPLFRSVAEHFGGRAVAAVLTGMGQDGAAGAVDIADRGGAVIAQDEASSVVWGMPGETFKRGACVAVTSVEQIGRQLVEYSSGARR